MYAIKFKCKNILGDTGFVIGKDQYAWVVDERDMITCRFIGATNDIPLSVKTWEDRTEAEKFIGKWEGHPWFCQPNGEFEVIDLKPIYKIELMSYQPQK